MLYIHTFNDLNRKSIDIESIAIIKELKKSVGFPLTEEALNTLFSEFRISSNDIETMNNVLLLVDECIKKITALPAKDSLYEPINLQRALSSLKSMPDSLKNNIVYSSGIMNWWNDFIKDAVVLLNSIPTLRTNEEKKTVNDRISSLFEKILRNNQIYFNHMDLVREGTVKYIEGLEEGMKNGYFFKVTLEEELKKLKFDRIKERIPAGKLEEAGKIEEIIVKIGLGIRRIYSINMQMVKCAVTLYSLVKWINTRM